MNYVHLVARRSGAVEILHDAEGTPFSTFAVEVLDVGGPVAVAAAGDDGSIDDAWPLDVIRAIVGRLGYYGRDDGTAILAVGLVELAGLDLESS